MIMVKNILKVATVLLLGAYLVFLCTRGLAKDIPVEDIQAWVAEEKTITELSECGDLELRRFYGLDGGTLEGYVFYKAESPMIVDEFLVAKASGQEQAKQALASAQQHLADQKKSFEGYGVSQIAQLKKAEVLMQGNYVIYAAGDHAKQWKDDFMNLIK